MRIRHLLALVAALSACGPAAAPLTPPPPLPPEVPLEPPAPPAPLGIAEDPAAAARIAADVHYLASPELAGRGTGEEGSKLAAVMIAKRFEELGLKPFGAPEGQPARFDQPFTARVGAKAEPADLAVAQGGAPRKADAADVGTCDGSASAKASGKAVFVGYGITAPAVGWDDYAGGSVEGKIVVILDGVPGTAPPAEDKAPPAPKPAPKGKGNKPAPPHAAPHAPPKQAAGAKPEGKQAPSLEALRDFGSVRYKLRTAREHKAAGVILITRGENLPAPPSDASSMGVPGVVLKRSAAKGLFRGAGLDEKGTWEIKRAGKPRALPYESVSIATKVDPVDATSANILGLLPAAADSSTAGEIVVVGAHYDHLGAHASRFSMAPGVDAPHPGADDNASGTALMLEVARRLRALPKAPLRSVLFMAFGAEELGTLGSHYWIEHSTVPLKQVVAMINADMVGRLRADKLIVDGTGTAAGWEPLLRAASEGLGLDIATGSEGFGASDHASFTAARIPVTFLFTGVHEDYHRPSDTADKINSDGEARIATLAARLAVGVAGSKDRLAFVDVPADPHGGSRGGFKVSIGTVPDYAWSGKGLRITGTRAESPAARAGLQAGDIIVKVGTHEVGNIHDYMFALGDLEAGRKVTIEVERDGKRISLEVIPAPGR